MKRAIRRQRNLVLFSCLHASSLSLPSFRSLHPHLRCPCIQLRWKGAFSAVLFIFTQLVNRVALAGIASLCVYARYGNTAFSMKLPVMVQNGGRECSFNAIQVVRRDTRGFPMTRNLRVTHCRKKRRKHNFASWFLFLWIHRQSGPLFISLRSGSLESCKKKSK